MRKTVLGGRVGSLAPCGILVRGSLGCRVLGPSLCANCFGVGVPLQVGKTLANGHPDDLDCFFALLLES